MYLINPALPAAIKRTFGPIYTPAREQVLHGLVQRERHRARRTRALGIGLWKGGDQAVIDGAIVNGHGKLVGRIAGVVRWLQTGYIYHYAFAMLLGVFVLMTYFVWLKLVSGSTLEKNKNGFVEPCHLDADLLRRRAAGVRSRRAGARACAGSR